MEANVRACWKHFTPPDGEYRGVWTDGRVRFHCDGTICVADVNCDYIVLGMPCFVTVRDGGVTSVETVSGRRLRLGMVNAKEIL